MDYIKLTERLVQDCLNNGAGSAEVYLENSRNLSVQVLNGEIETIQEAASTGVGFRVIVDGKMGFSHCNDLTDKSLEDTLKRAVDFAKLTTPDENNVLPDDKSIVTVDGLYDPSIAKIPMDQKIQMALDIEKLAMAHPGISKSSGSSYGESESEVFISNSNGIAKSGKSSGCYIGVSVVAEKGEQKNTGDEGCSRVFFADLKPLSEIAASAAKKAVLLLDPVQMPTQRASVIFDTEVAGSLLGGIIGAITGERVNQGASFLKDSLGKKFASELLTIVDDGILPKGLSSTPFDGEGVSTGKRTLVEKGVLKSFLYNTISAKRAGTKSTGNAARNGYSSLPGTGVHNIRIEPGTVSLDQIIASTTKGLLLKEVTGYGIDPVTGNFSGGANGLWIENGKVVHPVSGLTIAGSADEILNGIDLMGNDIDLNRSFASPSFRIREIQIGGNKS
jgi:PmbA protein